MNLFTKAVFLLALVASAALAQTFTGLPGLQLSAVPGPPQLQVTNTTGKAVVMLATLDDVKESGMIWMVDFPLPSDSKPRVIGQYTHHLNHNPSTVKIDAVIFADGSFTGPDTQGNFSGLVGAVQEFVALGQAMQSNSWSVMEGIVNQYSAAMPSTSPGDMHAAARVMAAKLALRIHQMNGDAGTAALAARFAALGTLHR